MKKRIISIIMVVLSLSVFSNAFAINHIETENNTISVIVPKSSSYLSTYRVSLVADSNQRMAINISVNGTSTMDKIGVSAIRIDQKVNGTWSTYDTLYAIDNPNFYQYNTANYVDTVSFYGTQGTEYRVTITAYAGKSGRYDSGTVTSYTAICK